MCVCTHSNRSAKEVRCGDMMIRMMHVVMMVVMMMMSGIRTATRSRLLRLDRHRRAGLARSLPKPVPFNAAKQKLYHSIKCVEIAIRCVGTKCGQKIVSPHQLISK